MKGELYIMMASRLASGENRLKSLGEHLRSTIRTSSTFKKVYESGLELTGIKNPSLGYRQSVQRVKSEGAIQVWDTSNPGTTFTIALVKRL